VLLAELTGEIIASGMEVHRLLGPGFLEAIYQRALSHELRLRGLSSEHELDIPIAYKGHSVGRHRLDLVVEKRVIVELKAADAIIDAHVAQTLSYMKAAALEVSLILNSGRPSLTWKRLARSLT
jgi:GxxExxY protein